MAVLVAEVAAGIAALDPPKVGLGSGVGAGYLALRGLVEQLQVVELRWLAAVDAAALAAEDGSASTTAWVRRHTGCSGRTAACDVPLARRLHTDGIRPLTTTAELLDSGQLTVERAAAIARATATLPTHGGLRPNVTVLVELDTLLANSSGSAAGGAEAGGWFANGQNLPAAATERIGCDARLSWVTTRTGELRPDGTAGIRPSEMGALTDDERELVRAALRQVSPALGTTPHRDPRPRPHPAARHPRPTQSAGHPRPRLQLARLRPNHPTGATPTT